MESLFEIFNHPDVMFYLLIPVISAAIGGVTNAIGITMMFKPLDFVGIKPFLGWQGIIPARARKFASLQMNQIESLIDLDALFDRIDGDEVSKILQPHLRLMIDDVMDVVGRRYSTTFWENLPDFVKESICRSVARGLPNDIDDLLSDIKKRHRKLIDTKAMVVDKLDAEKHLLIELIQKTVNSELRFLIKSGFVLGFLFGLVQMVLFFRFPDEWLVLPAGGFLVGYLTNWIAVKLMFRPLEPIKLGPLRLQGIFIKRKDQVAHDYSESLTKNVLNAQTLADYIMKSDADSQLNRLLRYHIKKTIDRSVGNGKYLLLVSLGTKKYLRYKNGFIDTMCYTQLPVQLQQGIEHTEKSINVAEIIKERMKSFSPRELEGFVKPVFEEDEWILYFGGGVLGFFAGWCQLVTLF